MMHASSLLSHIPGNMSEFVHFMHTFRSLEAKKSRISRTDSRHSLSSNNVTSMESDFVDESDFEDAGHLLIGLERDIDGVPARNNILKQTFNKSHNKYQVDIFNLEEFSSVSQGMAQQYKYMRYISFCFVF